MGLGSRSLPATNDGVEAILDMVVLTLVPVVTPWRLKEVE
jgi:hypothetical protein